MTTEKNRLRLVVRSIRDRASYVKEYELQQPDGGELPPFTPGAHLEVVTGNGGSRAYSLINDNADRRRYVIAVQLRLGSTSGSQFMHDFVNVGDELEIYAPSNSFTVDDTAEESVLIAAGIGITPLFAIARQLQAQSRAFTLHYIGRSVDEMAFHDDIVREFGDHAVIHVTRGPGQKRPLLEALIGNYAPGKHVYVCGPSELVAACRQKCSDWPVDTVHFELFINRQAGTHVIAAPAESFEVVLARSGKVLMVPADATLLEVLTKNGIRIPSACVSGFCGTCVVPLLAGTADHRDNVLTPVERMNRIQTCCSRAFGGERLVIDR